ncbi:hypothetical protein [Kerstersia gyiorum]|uniref:hypothetical protein n=1 Tax=Kerstersia gyiorum TaxID=206506 RepID=UPI0030D434AE
MSSDRPFWPVFSRIHCRLPDAAWYPALLRACHLWPAGRNLPAQDNREEGAVAVLAMAACLRVMLLLLLANDMRLFLFV